MAGKFEEYPQRRGDWFLAFVTLVTGAFIYLGVPILIGILGAKLLGF